MFHIFNRCSSNDKIAVLLYMKKSTSELNLSFLGVIIPMQLGLKFHLMIADKAVAVNARVANSKKKTCHTKDKIFMSLLFRTYSNLAKLGVERDNFFRNRNLLHYNYEVDFFK